MAEARKCDICGRYFDLEKTAIDRVKFGTYDAFGRFKEFEAYDLCLVCYDSIHELMDAMKGGDESDELESKPGFGSNNDQVNGGLSESENTQ